MRGKRSSNTRGCKAKEICEVTKSACKERNVRRASGPSQVVIASVTTAPVSAKTPTGSRIRRRPMPSAVKAMISLSADMRPSPSSTPISVAIGTVNTNTAGKMDKERQNLHAGTAVAHKQLHQPDQLRHEKDKSEDDKSEECVAENFADDIPVQDAHDANGECNTVATTLA